jgi:hypothetical protein
MQLSIQDVPPARIWSSQYRYRSLHPTFTLSIVALLHDRLSNLEAAGDVVVVPLPPQKVAPTQTDTPQQVATAQTSPDAQLLLSLQLASPAHCVLPSTQNPVLSAVLAQTHDPPGPHGPNVVHVWPVQLDEVHAPFTQVSPEAH